MPLSEYEERVLQQIEQGMRSDDPKLANTLAEKPRPSARRLGLGVLLFAVGLMALVGGVASQIVIIGVLGFVAMLAGVLLAMTGPKRQDVPGAPDGGSGGGGGGGTPRAGGPKPSGGFMQRQEERWQRRNEDRGR